jgi:carboxyl-terminal processing protease
MNRKRLLMIFGLATIPLAISAFVLQGQVSSTDGPKLFARVLQFVEQYSVDSLSNAEIYEKAARGLVKGLNDPYADLYSPDQLSSFQRNTLGNRYGGIGMQIESQDGLITVTKVFPGTPGERGGVQAGDRILLVDTVSTTGMRIDEVSGRLTGPAGTTVSATFGRAGVQDPIKMTFTRAVIEVPAVPFTVMLDGGVGYLLLQRFNESAGAQMEKATRDLMAQGATSMIIDLRGNPGGSLDQALEISNLFLQPGAEIASVRHRGREPEVYRANRKSIVDSTSIIVLVDNYSASASEIVAGALQDHDRALVVGVGSFGKGLVQTLFPLEGGWAIKLTTGKWYTPSGRSIQGAHTQLADGRFVEYAPDSVESDSARKARPIFHSAGGRLIYGGGGITPDVTVRQDTLWDSEQEFLRTVGPKWPTVNATIYAYARELQSETTPDFAVTPEWLEGLSRRLEKAEIPTVDGSYEAGARFLARQLEQRVATLRFGDSTAFRRQVPYDNQVQMALEYLRKGRTQRDLLALAAQSGGPSN